MGLKIELPARLLQRGGGGEFRAASVWLVQAAVPLWLLTGTAAGGRWAREAFAPESATSHGRICCPLLWNGRLRTCLRADSPCGRAAVLCAEWPMCNYSNSFILRRSNKLSGPSQCGSLASVMN